MLGFLGSRPLYNAINFNWGMNTTTTCGPIQITVYNTRVNEFICPSDRNAGVTNLNSYNDSTGTTTITPPSRRRPGARGFHVLAVATAFSDCIDGTSNTIAFSEALVGDNTTNYTRAAGILKLTSLPATAEVLDASSNWPAVQAGLQACNAAWNARSGTLNTGRGNFWFHGTQAQTMFNTVVTPNSKPYPWAYCSDAAIGDAEFIDGQQQPPRRRERPDGRRQRQVRQGLDQPADLVALGTRASGEVISSDSY